MKFVVDGMLGTLARSLRILGLDALFPPRADDDALLDIAHREERVLLTRDRALAGRSSKAPVLLIDGDNRSSQVRQVLDRFELRGGVRPFSRCLACNTVLRPLSREGAAKLVPPFVLERSTAFSLCPSCGRVFWPGTHHRRMEEEIREWLDET